MIFLRHVLVSIFCLVGLIYSFQDVARAEGYPSRIVKIVVPFPAGGPVDLAARLLADSLSVSLKQPFFVENRLGASGIIGAEAVARSDPDGHTILMTIDTPLTTSKALDKALPFDPELDFDPISIVASFSQMMVVHPAVPVQSVADFVRFAKEHHANYGSGGISGPSHLSMEYFRAKAGLELLHIPYKGNPQVLSDLIGGQIQSGFLATPSVVELVREGKLKGLAVSGSKRTLAAPDIPTMVEVGFPEFNIQSFLVVLVPAKTSQNIKDILERETLNALKKADVRRSLRQQSLDVVGSNSVDAKSQLHEAAVRWKTLIHDTNIQLEN